MHELLYDSPFEAQMWMVYDANKQLMGSGDALYPYPMTLAKGKYSMQVLVRHDSKAMLDKLTNLVVPVDFTLAKELAVPVFTTLQDALAGGDKFSAAGVQLARGARVKVFVGAPTDKAPGGKHGDVLVGMLRVGCGEEWKRRTRQDCVLHVLVPKDAAAADSSKDDNKDKTDAELEQQEVRDARLKRLKKLREDKKCETFDALAASLLADFPAHLPLLEEVMKRWDTEGDDAESVAGKSERCSKAIKAADAIVAAVDCVAMAAHYGVKHDDVSEAQIDTRRCISES
jgi:tripeptidyl-peptidase-2